MSPPNYRMAERCCATCNESAGGYCGRHSEMPVSRHCVCDDWQPEGDDV